MVQAQQRAPVRGPTFIRLLARLADVDIAPSSQSLPDRLSQWLDWNHALALSAALDARPAVTDFAGPAPDGLDAECARAREVLIAAIKDDPALAMGTSAGPPAGADAAPADDTTPDFSVLRQCYLARQRAMQAATGRLRGRLREALARSSAGMARLAEVDAVMELALSPREHALLANVPDLLGQRFERLRAAGQASRAWLEGFRRDMQSVLLAELDLRFQPVEGLLAALRTESLT
jgi:hypothetical protein